MFKDHKIKHKHLPPHERRSLIHIDFTDADIAIFQQIYGNEDEAMAAMQVLLDAPPEIQILATQLIDIIQEVNGYEG